MKKFALIFLILSLNNSLNSADISKNFLQKSVTTVANVSNIKTAMFYLMLVHTHKFFEAIAHELGHGIVKKVLYSDDLNLHFFVKSSQDLENQKHLFKLKLKHLVLAIHSLNVNKGSFSLWTDPSNYSANKFKDFLYCMGGPIAGTAFNVILYKIFGQHNKLIQTYLEFMILMHLTNSSSGDFKIILQNNFGLNPSANFDRSLRFIDFIATFLILMKNLNA